MILSNHSIIKTTTAATTTPEICSSSSVPVVGGGKDNRDDDKKDPTTKTFKCTDDTTSNSDGISETALMSSSFRLHHFDLDHDDDDDDDDSEEDHHHHIIVEKAMNTSPQHNSNEQQEGTTSPSAADADAQQSEYVVPKLCPKTIQEARSSFSSSSTGSSTNTTSTSSDVHGNSDKTIQKYLVRSSRKTKRVVSFNHVTIRRYCMILGDNPTVNMGPPVSIGWEYEELPELDITMYERTRSKQRRTGNLHNLIINYHQRYDLLLRLGYDESDIDKAEKDANKIRFKRSITKAVSQIPMVCKVEEITQSLTRKLKRIVVAANER